MIDNPLLNPNTQVDKYKAALRGAHLYFMQVPPAINNVLPTEELRDKIDGPNICPKRRHFARTIELFECELRTPAPGVTWEMLARGAAVPPSITGGFPTLAERIVRRSYNEYCEPTRNFQPMWEAETRKLVRLSNKLVRQQRRELIAVIFVGVTVGLGGQAIYAASLFCTPIGNFTLAIYTLACLFSITLLLHVRRQRVRARI